MFLPLKDHNPTVRTPLVTIVLIALNVLVFLIEIAQGDQMGLFIAKWGATPWELTRMQDLIGAVPGSPLVHVPGPAVLYITAFSSMFLHGGWMHLGFNMLYLWIFGNNIEDHLGRLRFIVFYLATGLIGLLTHVMLHPSSAVPVVGASGAISGVLGAYLVLYPQARVTSLVFLGFFAQFVQVPAVVLLVVWILFQFVGGLIGLGIPGGGVAYWAHIGGFAAGWLSLRYLARGQIRARKETRRWQKIRRPEIPRDDVRGPFSSSDGSGSIRRPKRWRDPLDEFIDD